MNEQQRATLLARCRLFTGAPEQDLRRLAAVSSVRTYRRGQIAFSEGDSGDSLLVVAEGSLKAFATSPHGEEFLLAVVGPGDTLGELTVADGGRRSASVAALTDATVLRVPRESVLDVAASSPAVMKALLSTLAGVVRRLTGAAADLVFLDLPRRVGKLLLELRASTGSDVVDIPLTQAEMASRVGASRQSVNSALGEFTRRGWIRVEAHQIRVLDPRALARYVGD